jgi:enamine deaminase RidA (YjgF/YER057c/UK114 family)
LTWIPSPNERLLRRADDFSSETQFRRDLPVYRRVRKEFLVQPYPASTAAGVTELAPPGNRIEIEAVAML